MKRLLFIALLTCLAFVASHAQNSIVSRPHSQEQRSSTHNDRRNNTQRTSSVRTTPIPKAVDLGLSVKWASFNLGARVPEGDGGFYSWGETKPKKRFGWNNYKYAKGSHIKLTKYCDDKLYGYQGFGDNKNTLEPKDDAAYVNLGSPWRIPTSDEMIELMEKCKHEWTTLNGVRGVRVTGPNGNSIFLPAADRVIIYGTHIYKGKYITSFGSSYGVSILRFYDDSWEMIGESRSWKFSIRPVCDK